MILGSAAYVASAEDTILAKLEWARGGDSDRRWAATLELTTELDAACEAATSAE